MTREGGLRRTDVVSDPEVDAIIIGTWPYTHKAMVIASLQNGKHVMTEARMACVVPPQASVPLFSAGPTHRIAGGRMDATEAVEMLAVSQLHPELICQIVPSPMTLKWDKTIQRLLLEGAIGDLLGAPPSVWPLLPPAPPA